MAESPKTILRLIKTEALDSSKEGVEARRSPGDSQELQKSLPSDLPPRRQRPLAQFLNRYCDAIDADIERIMKL